jgi:imidazolonepropionase-like amidohydrolase
LSVLAEMRLVAGTHSLVPSRTILELGTLQSARALGIAGEVGSLEPGKRADLAVVALPEQEAADPHDLLFDFDGPVVARWYRGREDA